MNFDLLRQPVTRRQFTIGGAAGLTALALGAKPMLRAAAQSDADPFGAMGYPELAITVSATSFDGLPQSTAAGRYLIKGTSTLSDNSDNSGAIAFLSPTPAGISAADFLKMFTGSGDDPAATPDAGGGEEQSGPLPLSIYKMYFAGGVSVPPGQSAQAVIDLTPGEYVVWGDDPSVSAQPVILQVTGDFPQDVKDPVSDVTATLIDFAITVEGNLTAGSHIMKVQHHGAQPHFLDIEKGPDTMTKEMVEAAIMSEMSGTPAADGMSESDLKPVFFSPTQSIATVTFQQIDLTDGTFLAACFFPTAGTGAPHAANGMLDVFQVGATATPTS